uniref:Uncharacterized protein n=1 Tax=Equus caballus TaxID=9796 RepID=A0A3Q2GSQ2_HORSE
NEKLNTCPSGGGGPRSRRPAAQQPSVETLDSPTGSHVEWCKQLIAATISSQISGPVTSENVSRDYKALRDGNKLAQMEEAPLFPGESIKRWLGPNSPADVSGHADVGQLLSYH